jgi:hypothetical protein
MQAAGFLPRSPEVLRFDIDARATPRRIVAVFDKHGVDTAARDDVLAAIRPAAASPGERTTQLNGTGS